MEARKVPPEPSESENWSNVQCPTSNVTRDFGPWPLDIERWTSLLLAAGAHMGMVPLMMGSRPVSPNELRKAIDTARRAAEQTVRRRSVDEILGRLDRVITNWQRPDYHLRRRAEAELPGGTGFSAATIRHGLPLLLNSLRGDAIGSLLDAELGDRHVLDRACDGRRALGPPLIVHVLSGNIPGLAATPVLLSLAIKSAVLIKPAAGDPLFPQLLAASIAEVDAELGQCVVVAGWRGGDRDIEAIAFAEADLVVASGSDAAIAAIQARVSRRFLGYGHKISFAIIGRERLADGAAARELARRLAYDVSLWDQQGCLSPQLCYIESGNVTPAQFAEMLAQALAKYAAELPPRHLSFDEQAAVQRFRQEAEWSGAESATVFASAGSTDWTVSVEPDARFLPSCLNRCIRLKVVPSLAVLATALPPHRRLLEGAGVAVGPVRAAEVGEMLAASGVHRICPIGTMQLPPVAWRQGGRPRVGDWVEWTMEEI